MKFNHNTYRTLFLSALFGGLTLLGACEKNEKDAEATDKKSDIELMEQGRHGLSEEQIKAHLNKMAEKLDLSEAQQESIFNLKMEHMAAMKALKEGGEATRADFKKLRDVHHEAVKAELTPEQQVQWESMAMKAQKHRKRKHKRNPEQHMEMLSEKLQLDETQVAALKEVNSDFHARMKELKSSEDFSKEDIKALWDEKNAAWAEILTPEQMEELEAIKAEKKRECEGECEKKGKHGHRGHKGQKGQKA